MCDAELLEVSGIAAAYGDVPALWDVSLGVASGQVTALLGRNGAGKTTTLRTIAGLNRATRGTVALEGRDIAGLPAHRRAGAGIALVQENKRIFRQRTVEENLLLGGYPARSQRRELRARCEQMYERFPVLGERRAGRAGSLSGGQQQMLAIAQALMAGPKVLMLDEPSAGLAPSAVGDTLRLVRELCDEGLGVLLVEQSAETSVAAADRVVVLDIGRVVLDRPASEVEDLTVIERAYMGQPA